MFKHQQNIIFSLLTTLLLELSTSGLGSAILTFCLAMIFNYLFDMVVFYTSTQKYNNKD